MLVPQDIDYPALQLDIDRVRASELGLNEKEVVGNVITALTSDQMIAPELLGGPQDRQRLFPHRPIPGELREEPGRPGVRAAARRALNPAHAPRRRQPASRHIKAPTEVDHYQLRRMIDVYVVASGEDLSRVLSGVQRIIRRDQTAGNVRVDGARLGARDAGVLPQLRLRTAPFDAAGLSDPGRPV